MLMVSPTPSRSSTKARLRLDRWTEIEVFVQIAESGSISRAAEALGISVSATSRYLMNLEERLNIRLVHRTTRQLSLTGDGEVFCERCRDILGSMKEAEASVSEPRAIRPASSAFRRLFPSASCTSRHCFQRFGKSTPRYASR